MNTEGQEEKPLSELKLSELVEQSLQKGVIPVFNFVDKDFLEKELLNKSYNQAIDDAVQTISSYKTIGMDTLFNMNLNVICKRLSELKK